MMKAFRTGSGYYIDVGASELIAEGGSRSEAGVEIQGASKSGSVELSDGSELPADLIVMATGFQSMNCAIAQIMSEEVADKVGKVLGLGSGCRAIPGPGKASRATCGSRPSSRAFGFTAAISHLSRHYSLVLALQLKARMEGLPTPVYGLQAVHHTR